MNRESKFSGTLLEQTNARLWQAVDLLRGSVNSSDYDIILFLLVLERYHVFTGYKLSSLEEFKQDLHTSIKNYQGENAGVIQQAYNEYYRNALNEVEDKVIVDLVYILAAIDDDLLAMYMAEIFDELLYKIVKSQGRIGGEFSLPAEISRLVGSLASLNEGATVYNPFAGLASFGMLLNSGVIYIGQEINRKIWAMGNLRIIAYNKTATATLLLGDSINEWNPERSTTGALTAEFFNYRSYRKKYDLIVSNPPFNMRIPNTVGRFGSIKTAEHFLIEKGLEDLKEEGKLIAVIGQGFLWNPASESLRRTLVEGDLLEAVISFPGGLLMNTGIPISILVINKQKITKRVVRFIEAKTYVNTNASKQKILDVDVLSTRINSPDESASIRSITSASLKSADYNLNAERFFRKEYIGTALRKVLSPVRSQRVPDTQKGKFVRIRDLKDDPLDFYLDIHGIEAVNITRVTQKIEESCLLLATRWKTFKPTYFQYAGTAIYVSPDILAFHVDQKLCDISYLVNELHSKPVSEQLDALSTGTVVSAIKKEDLLSIVVTLPTVEDQKTIVKQNAMILAEEKKKELALFNKIHGLEAEMLEQNAYLRHTLAGPSSNLKDAVSSLKKILFDQVIPLHPGMLELKVSDKHLVSLGEYLDIVERDVAKIVNAVKSQLKVDIGMEAKQLMPIEIISFLEKYAIEYNAREDLHFKVEFDFDQDVFIDQNGDRIKTFISANDDLLRDLLDNLIDNAVKHAFESGKENRVEIYLMKDSGNEKSDEIQILVSNTGKPFSKDYNLSEFSRKGSKYGPNAGDGFGGWYINEIIKKMNGSFDIIDETGPGGLSGTDLATSIEINFPIAETEENV